MPDNFIDILLIQQGTHFPRPQRSRRRLVRETLELGPMFAGFTELGTDDDWTTAREAVLRAGYQFVGSKDWEPVIAVHPDVVITGQGAELVHPRSEHWYKREALWVTGRINDDPNLEVAFVEFHAITITGGGDRQSRRKEMATTVSSLMRKHSLGRKIGFGAGDLNEVDSAKEDDGVQHAILRENGVVTCWDELGYYPPTHGNRNIDAILRMQWDKRVEFIEGDAERVEESDHSRVHAVARIALPEIILPPPPPPEPVLHECGDRGCVDFHEVVPA